MRNAILAVAVFTAGILGRAQTDTKPRKTASGCVTVSTKDNGQRPCTPEVENKLRAMFDPAPNSAHFIDPETGEVLAAKPVPLPVVIRMLSGALAADEAFIGAYRGDVTPKVAKAAAAAWRKTIEQFEAEYGCMAYLDDNFAFYCLVREDK